MYSDNQVIYVYPFSRQPDGEEVVIGRAETGAFLAIPDRAISLLDHLASGATVGEARDQYQKIYNEVPDVDSFLTALEQYQIVALASESTAASLATEAAQRDAKTDARSRRLLISEKFAQLIFGVPALVTYCLIVCLAVLAIALRPSIFATQKDLMFPDHRTLTIILISIGSYVALALHEMGHLVAARALGIRSRFGIGHRLWVLVVETDLTGLWSSPREKRYVPFLAGMIVDAVSGSLLFLLLFAAASHAVTLAPFVERFIRAMVFIYLMRLVWQFSFFVRTDLYYVIAAWLRCKNLMQDTEVYLHNLLAEFVPGLHRRDQSGIPKRERTAIRWYAFIWFAGRILSLTLLITITLPVSFYYMRSIGAALARGYHAEPAAYVDSILVALYILLPIVIGMGMWLTSIARKLRGVPS